MQNSICKRFNFPLCDANGSDVRPCRGTPIRPSVLQGREADAPETGGVEVQRLGAGPRRCRRQLRHAGQRPQLLHGLWSNHCLGRTRLSLQSVFFVCGCDRTVFLLVLQNEPTFYTTDGTPFTAADPGGYITMSSPFVFFYSVLYVVSERYSQIVSMDLNLKW